MTSLFIEQRHAPFEYGHSALQNHEMEAGTPALNAAPERLQHNPERPERDT
ncbi:hypothetical protein ACIBQX_33540 [Nonomuraea sp. NPDC049714]|uniref:hypothetical protein n=1 Tax=Nonomuraea sp. NPDC049714 TaxID=3364357 RepID=UPI0037B097EC